MKISIGILAYNESAIISSTLQSLFKQSVFQEADPNLEVEVVIVPNGCKDNTAAVASQALAQLTAKVNNPYLSWRVCEVEEGGKANAWNLYTHQFTDPRSEYLILMDADIQFLEYRTLYAMVDTLEQNRDAWASVDTLVKDVALKPKKNVFDRLSIAASGVAGAKSVWMCGHLYCGRADILRRIWLPKGIFADDGFIAHMVVNDCLRGSEKLDRIVRAEGASHVYEAAMKISSLFGHQLRQIIADTMNEFIYEDLLQDKYAGQDLGLLIKSRNETDPGWVDRLIQATVQSKGWWVIPRFRVFQRLNSLRHRPWKKAMAMSIPLTIAFGIDLVLCVIANRKFHRWGIKRFGWSHGSYRATQLTQ